MSDVATRAHATGERRQWHAEGVMAVDLGASASVSGSKSAADMARLYGVSQPTVSRIVAAHLSG